jgi:hypothetical protein
LDRAHRQPSPSRRPSRIHRAPWLISPLSVKDPRVKRGRGLYSSIRPVGGSRSPTNADCGKKASDDSRAISCRWTPSLISVLGLRLWVCPRTRRLHDDRWGALPPNTDAAARSFEADQLEEVLPRWQQGAPRSRPLPATLPGSSYVWGSATKCTNAFPKAFFLRNRPSQALLLTASGSLIASSPSSRRV